MPSGLSKSLRFKPIWCSHHSLTNVVQQAYEGTCNLLEGTTKFQNEVTTWNKLVFGNIFHKKKYVLARLGGIQKSNTYPFSPYLQQLECQFLEDYSAILRSEKEF